MSKEKKEEETPKEETKETTVEAEEPVPEVVPSEQEQNLEAATAEIEVQPPPEPDPKDAEIEKLKAQVSQIREPLVTELVAKGYDKAKLNPLDVPTLQLMVTHARASVTQGLPGTVPQPEPEKPKIVAERVEDVYKDAQKRSIQKGKERWKDW